MEHDRFDQLSRYFAESRSRRGLVRTVGAVLGATAITTIAAESVLGADVEGNKKPKCKSKCKHGAKCINGKCIPTCPTAGTCAGGNVPTCGSSSCGCVAEAKTGTAICAAEPSMNPRPCQKSSDCKKGQVCADVPGCAPNIPRFCVKGCP